MRTASDGRGDDAGENPVSVAPSDDESTHVFTRERTRDAPTGTTHAFARETENTRAFVRGTGATENAAADAATTRAFTRDQPGADTSGSATTRAFVRPGAATGEAPLDPVDPPDTTDRGSGSGLTRRFVRERPARAAHPPRSAPLRPPNRTIPTHRPNPRTPGPRWARTPTTGVRPRATATAGRRTTAVRVATVRDRPRSARAAAASARAG
ncbi:hypothetical protein BJF83_02295 [Nocardiopsis sp. CNR-923]|nr:hypothetical protein BJF83_02295 [Nocardiopsis sp. CNR-923]